MRRPDESWPRSARFPAGEKATMGAFIVTLALWLVPGTLEYALGSDSPIARLAAHMGRALADATGVTDVWAITALAILMAIFLSELASNTAAATTLVPVVIALAEGAGVSPIPPALGAIIGANLGFMLPVSTAPNAIVYSSGLVPARVLMTIGLVFDLLGFAVTWTCLRLLIPPLGLA